MNRITRYFACVALVAFLFTINSSAQTVGGNTSLNSKTYTFANLTADLPQTTLFTPTVDGDFLISVYVTIQNNMFNCIAPFVQYTDEFGTNVQSFLFSPSPGTLTSGAVPYNQSATGVGAVIQIHALANTPVSASVISNACGGSPTATFDVVFGKIKINP